MTSQITRFATTTLLPVPFLLTGLVWGGWPAWIAVVYICILTAIADLALPERAGNASDQQDDGAFLNLLLGVLHFPVLFIAIWALAGHGVSVLTPTGLALYFAVGIYLGQVSNSNAHELIHQGRRFNRNLGRWVFNSVLFGHHASAHPLVHHTHVATPLDPNSARRNEPFFRYFRRAWIDSFKAGLKVETERHSPLQNPYLIYILGAGAALLISVMLAGWKGLILHLSLASFAQMQLLMSDYVQHYGLTRQKTPQGRYVPVGSEHSWNAPHSFSRHWMLNAPRHSDHHQNPTKSYTVLKNSGDAPQLPYPLPVMGAIALFPRRWKRIMHPRLDALAQEQVEEKNA